MAAQLHFSEDALALHLLLKGFEGLIDVVVAHENLQAVILSVEVASRRDPVIGARASTIMGKRSRDASGAPQPLQRGYQNRQLLSRALSA
ncbi:MAG: hypothetical protein JO273_23455 [Methylobacteriaceae bacterium]|nr:hypothetical protein [Methylobacteriaceae bacterium]